MQLGSTGLSGVPADIGARVKWFAHGRSALVRIVAADAKLNAHGNSWSRRVGQSEYGERPHCIPCGQPRGAPRTAATSAQPDHGRYGPRVPRIMRLSAFLQSRRWVWMVPQAHVKRTSSPSIRSTKPARPNVKSRPDHVNAISLGRTATRPNLHPRRPREGGGLSPGPVE